MKIALPPVCEAHPVAAYNVEKQELIQKFPTRASAARHFNVCPRRIVQVIARRGKTRINGQWIAFRNTTLDEE